MKLKFLLLLLALSLSPTLSFSQTENHQRPQYIDFVPLDSQGYLNPASLGKPVNPKEVMVFDRPMTTSLKEEQFAGRETSKTATQVGKGVSTIPELEVRQTEQR